MEEAKKEAGVTEKEIKDIFSNIDLVFQFNKKLMRDLERIRSFDPNNAAPGTNPPSIGDVFLENVSLYPPLLSVYRMRQFINNTLLLGTSYEVVFPVRQ